ncbi:G-protein alpha subunit-domain-containing protein [Roridomyces roridus]|uniref:G-protein alpha subunit-domain-containing protein n=1 Tax=Roridomyces roridus TaxID=1738132 RepID=A0AAD7FJX2_9AGAR|nr:G-protein alpha subunit-domain-containing protein [Roridomyces roridus]
MNSSSNDVSLSLIPAASLPLTRPTPGPLVPISTFIGPGKTLHELYSSLGLVAERHANRAAHAFGLGPAAAAERIRFFFGDGIAREEALTRLKSTPLSPKLERYCARLTTYAGRSEASSTQLEAFQSIVELSTRYIGIRRLLLTPRDPQSEEGFSEENIAEAWNRDEATEARWHFACEFAAACLADRDIALTVEAVLPRDIGSVASTSGLSLIEQLLVASDSEGASKFSQPLAIRYLGGILELPSFWRQNGTIYRGVVQKLLAKSTVLLKDLNVDSTETTDSETTELLYDVEGVDIFCGALLHGIHAWLPEQSSSNTNEGWYPSLYSLLQLLGQPRCEELLPISTAMATAPNLKSIVPTVPAEQIVEFQTNPQISNPSLPFNNMFRLGGKRRQREPPVVKPVVSSSPSLPPGLSQEIKILLLGTEGSDPIGLMTDLKLLHMDGYSLTERLACRPVIYTHTVQSMRAIVEALPILNILLAPENTGHQSTVLNSPAQIEDTILPRRLAQAITALWQDPGVREAIRRSREFPLPASAVYFLNAIERIGTSDYIPVDKDVLRIRLRTTRIMETTFKVGELTYRLCHIGGWRSEPQKWGQYFEDATALVFLASLSNYDEEYAGLNQMEEALKLFETISNSRWFARKSILLFLNTDSLVEKLLRSPINRHFADYTGSDNYDAACEYFLQRFVSLVPNPQIRPVYAHFTSTADPDTRQSKFILSAIQDILLQIHLKLSGLLDPRRLL